MRPADGHPPKRRGIRLGSLLAGLGLAAALLSLHAPTARADGEMTFSVVPLGDRAETISATGQITEDTPDRFATFLDENPSLRDRHPIVFLASPGGRVIASIELGKLLRGIGAAAVVGRIGTDAAGETVMTSGDCLSACVYALIGARTRIIPPSSRVGIHRMFAYEADVDPSSMTAVIRRRYDNGNLGSFLMRYSSEMGVSPGLIAAAEHIPSDTLKILSRTEIRRWHLGVSR